MSFDSHEKTPAISIIAPMYNVGKYLEECLDSILSQTFQDYELIIVDDRSTDNSVEIVENYKPRFEGKLKLVTMEKNTGAAALPRNFGIKLAKGKYIAFMDPDDLFTQNALASLYKAAEETQADVVHTEKYFTCGEERVKEGTQLKVKTSEAGLKVDKITLETEKLEERINLYIKLRFFWYPWGKLFRRDLVIKNDIQFPNWPTADDTIFCFKCLCLAKNYVRIPDITYIYRLRDDSLTNKTLQVEKYLHRWLRIVVEGTAILDDFTNKFEIFVEKPELKYAVIDFFIQEKLNWIYKIYPESTILKIYNLLHKEFDEYGEDAALMAYMFNIMNIYRIRLMRSEQYVAHYQQQLKELQQKINQR